MQGYITRIAPSPTGDMHLGTARTAYFNWLAAKASGGQFILRIDDTDLDRNKEECINVIYKTMDWLNLKADAVFQQSLRTSSYVKTAEQLLDNGIAVKLDNGAIALLWDKDNPRTWVDAISGTQYITDTNIEQIDRRLILLRGGDKLGQPTYPLASIYDDYDLGVNYIIRGKDHISNTPKQLAIWWAINKINKAHRPIPKFTHLGLITKDKKKLSKRDGAASMLSYMEKGYDSDAILNFMLRLGWGPRVDDKTTAVIDKERAIDMFLVDGNMRNSDAGFDQAKLDSFDKKYKAIKRVA